MDECDALWPLFDELTQSEWLALELLEQSGPAPLFQQHYDLTEAVYLLRSWDAVACIAPHMWDLTRLGSTLLAMRRDAFWLVA